MQAKPVDISEWEEIPCECGGTASRSAIKYKTYDVRGWTCKKCGREYIHPADSLKISKLEALKKMHPRVKIRTLGQSLIITLPKEIVEIYDLKKGESIELIPENLRKLEIEV